MAFPRPLLYLGSTPRKDTWSTGTVKLWRPRSGGGNRIPPPPPSSWGLMTGSPVAGNYPNEEIHFV